MTSHPYFFGYGSLVNTATHSYLDPRPAQLHGWQRCWCHTPLRDEAFLSVTPAPQGGQINGLIAAVPNADWQALDEREFAYERLPGAGLVSHDMNEPPEISFYSVPEASQSTDSHRHPILLSYLDVVVQGHLQVFGAAGVDAFFATTQGWEAPVLDDRAAPRYPRAQVLSAAETALVDRHLATLGARIITIT